MEVDLAVSSRVLKQGEVLTVNCTVKDTEMVYFSWEFPRRQVPPPLSLICSRTSLIFVVVAVASGNRTSDRIPAQSDPLLCQHLQGNSG